MRRLGALVVEGHTYQRAISLQMNACREGFRASVTEQAEAEEGLDKILPRGVLTARIVVIVGGRRAVALCAWRVIRQLARKTRASDLEPQFDGPQGFKGRSPILVQAAIGGQKRRRGWRRTFV